LAIKNAIHKKATYLNDLTGNTDFEWVRIEKTGLKGIVLRLRGLSEHKKKCFATMRLVFAT
jgi:hypothetical protein